MGLDLGCVIVFGLRYYRLFGFSVWRWLAVLGYCVLGFGFCIFCVIYLWVGATLVCLVWVLMIGCLGCFLGFSVVMFLEVGVLRGCLAFTVCFKIVCCLSHGFIALCVYLAFTFCVADGYYFGLCVFGFSCWLG